MGSSANRSNVVAVTVEVDPVYVDTVVDVAVVLVVSVAVVVELTLVEVAVVSVLVLVPVVPVVVELTLVEVAVVVVAVVVELMVVIDETVIDEVVDVVVGFRMPSGHTSQTNFRFVRQSALSNRSSPSSQCRRPVVPC